MSIAAKKVVTIHYHVSDSNTGEVFDSSEGQEPLVYLHGAQNVIPGLEKALEGQAVGFTFDVVIPASEAYGERLEELCSQVPMEAFQGVDKVEVGMEFHADGPQGPVMVEVVSVDEDTVTVDANHPLAGRNLKFKGEVVAIRDASEEELAHGHVHGEGGHHH